MADFKFYLSRQGPKGEPGAKGEKGDNGNTPTFSDGINTPTVYTMQIDMGDGNVFETQNLKYPMRDDGGNYLRYDRTNSTVTLSAPNVADLHRTSGEVTLASVNDVENEDAQDTDAVSMELRNADQLALNNEINRIDRDINTVDDKVDREIQNRQDADTQLTDKINTDVGNEATARSNADAALSGRIDGLDNTKANKSEVYTKSQADSLLNSKSNISHTHNYNDLTNKPVIGNGTITITQGGVTKGTFTTNQSGNSTVELDAGGGGDATYTEGPGITINQNNEISANVDNNTIVIDGNSLKANIPDVSNFVTNSSLATTLQSYPTNTQLANTLESYPTNNALSNAITYQTVSTPGSATYTFDRTMNLMPYEYSLNPNIEKDGRWSKVGTSIYTRDKQLVIPSEASYDNGLWLSILYFNETNECVKGKSGYTFSFECNPQITIHYYVPEDSNALNYKAITVNTLSDEVFEISSSSEGYTTLNIRLLKNIYITYLNVAYNYNGNGHTPSVSLAPLYNFNGEVEVYTRSEGTPTTITKAVIASTAVDGTTIGVNSSGQLQSLVEEPGAATSSTLGLVKPDNSTISIDLSGIISATTAPALIIDALNKTAAVNPEAINTNNQLDIVKTKTGVAKLALANNVIGTNSPLSTYQNNLTAYYPWMTQGNQTELNDSTGIVTFSNDIDYASDQCIIYSKNTFIPNDNNEITLQFATGSNVSNVASSNSTILYADTDGYLFYTLKISESHFVISIPTSGMTKEEYTLSDFLVEANTLYRITISKDFNQANTFNVVIFNLSTWNFYSQSIVTAATPSFSTSPTLLNLSRQGYEVLSNIDLASSNFGSDNLNAQAIDKQIVIMLEYDRETLDASNGYLKVKPSIDGGTL